MNMVIVLFLIKSSFADFTYTTNDIYYKNKILAAQVKVNDTIKSQCFKDFIMKRSRLEQTNGKTRDQVIEDIRSQSVSINVNTYRKNNGVIGFRQPPSKDININKYFHDQYFACSSAANLAHESSHVIGYTHDFKLTKRRPYSVPYTISSAFNVCCK